MEHILLVIHVILAAALIGMVLIQRSETDGFGMGSGSGSNFMTGRATANLMTRTTAILATCFILTSLGLGILAAHGQESSITEEITQQEESSPSVPLAVEHTDDNGAIAPALDRDSAMDTDKAAKKASDKKAKPVAAPETDAPAVPTAD